MEYDINEIRAHPLLRDIGEQSLQRALAAAVMSVFPRHATLVSEGARCDLLYLLLEGTPRHRAAIMAAPRRCFC